MTDTKIYYEENEQLLKPKELSEILARQVKKLICVKKSLIVVLEGYDASGKSGCAERIVRYMDENDYKVIFKRVDEAGYKGCCGLEYIPTLDAEESLKISKELYG